MIRFFRAPWSTNCERVAFALAHKGLGAEAVLIDYADRFPVEEVSGQGLVPVIADGDTVVADSLRILGYLEDEHPEPRLFPADRRGRAQVDLFCQWFDGVWKVAPNAIEAEMETESPAQTRVDPAAAQIQGHLDLFEALLERDDYLAGAEVGAADFTAFPFLKYARGREAGDDELFHQLLDEHQDLNGRPTLGAWIDRVDRLPRVYGDRAEG